MLLFLNEGEYGVLKGLKGVKNFDFVFFSDCEDEWGEG